MWGKGVPSLTIVLKICEVDGRCLSTVLHSRTTKGRRALGGHELRGRVAKGLASMLWDTCKTVACLFGPSPLCIHFQIPINGCRFSRSRSTFPSLSSFTAGRRLSASIVALYKIVACTTCIIFLTRHAVSLARCEVFWFFSRRIILRSGRFVWWPLLWDGRAPSNLTNSELNASIGPFLM